MTCLLSRWVGQRGRLAFLVVTVSLLAHSVPAAVELGPFLTDTNAAEQHRQQMFYQAELSHQEQLKVGRERYQKKLDRRAADLAGMEAQLQIQAQTIALAPPTVQTEGSDIRGFGIGVQLLIAGLLIVSIFGFEYFARRRKSS